MNRRRLVHLLVAHALADDEPVGDVLRTVRGPGGPAAAALVEGGDLASGLRRSLLPQDLVALAEQAPRALRPALRLLQGIPSGRALLAPLMETLLLLIVVGCLQVAVITLFAAQVGPALAPFGARPGLWMSGPQAVLPWFVLAVNVWLGVCVFAPQRVPFVGGPLRRARSAALDLARLDGSPGADDAADRLAIAVRRARLAATRMAVGARVGGFGVLVTLGAVLAVGAYGQISRVWTLGL